MAYHRFDNSRSALRYRFPIVRDISIASAKSGSWAVTRIPSAVSCRKILSPGLRSYFSSVSLGMVTPAELPIGRMTVSRTRMTGPGERYNNGTHGGVAGGGQAALRRRAYGPP